MNALRRPYVLVLGSGFGGLETAYYLRWRLGERATISVVSDQDRFLFKPNTIYVPFGLDPERLMVPLAEPMQRREILFIRERAVDIDPVRRVVRTETRRLPYDYLVVATGATMRPAEVPGLGANAHTIWTVDEMLRLRAAFGRLAEDAARRQQRHVLFLVPPNNKCSGPLYEMVMMLDSWLRRRRARRPVDITWTTYEDSYIQAFGPRLHDVVSAEFERRGIAGHTGAVVREVRPGCVQYANGAELPYDLLVSFPPYAGATSFDALALDARGFIATDPGTRQVVGHPDIYAVGDAGDFPLKQAFLAFLQADVAAEGIAAAILGERAVAPFEPTAMCVMEQLDKATFAQVPLRLTGLSARPVEVRPDAGNRYRVGSSRSWRLGKKLLGVYLPWRFGSGRPFHAGLPWRGIDLGLRVMSRLLAA